MKAAPENVFLCCSGKMYVSFTTLKKGERAVEGRNNLSFDEWIIASYRMQRADFYPFQFHSHHEFEIYFSC